MDSSSQIPEPITLLRTKLRKPRLGGDPIPRPLLVEPLNRGLDLTPRVTLVSAPAGCGKTSLSCQWLDVCDRPSAWLSLDHTDNDLVMFLSYLIAAFQTLFDDACGQTRSLLRSPTQPPLDYVATTLINELAATVDFVNPA